MIRIISKIPCEKVNFGLTTPEQKRLFFGRKINLKVLNLEPNKEETKAKHIKHICYTLDIASQLVVRRELWDACLWLCSVHKSVTAHN